MKTILEVVRDLIKPYIDKNANNIAPVEDSPVENPYYVGDQLIYKGVLYNVTSDISIGDSLDIGTNISVAPKINSSVKSVLNKLRSNGSSSGTDFNFDIQNGIAGWNSATTRDAATFHPFTSGSTASGVTYTNTTSGLTATNVQTAIDEVDGNVDTAITNINKKLPTYANGTSYWDTTPTASSTKPVTSGGVKTQIDSINGNKANQTVIATRQANLVASRKYEIGDSFIYNNNNYKATATINQNGTINIGTNGNAKQVSSIMDQLTKLYYKERTNYVYGNFTNFLYEYRYGNIVYVLGAFSNVYNLSGQWFNVADLTYTPIREFQGYGTKADGTGVMQIKVGTNKILQTYPDSALTAGITCFFQFMYIVMD